MIRIGPRDQWRIRRTSMLSGSALWFLATLPIGGMMDVANESMTGAAINLSNRLAVCSATRCPATWIWASSTAAARRPGRRSGLLAAVAGGWHASCASR